MRNKILDVYCVDRTPEGVWTDLYIDRFWPDWLRNPDQQMLNNAAKAREAKFKTKMSKFAQQNKTLDQVADQLPEPPKEEIPEPQIPQEEPEGSDKPFDEAELKLRKNL